MPGSRKATVVGGIVPVSVLRRADKDQMWRLFEHHYEDVTRERFEADLAAKNHAILLRDARTRAIVGFSTLAQETTTHEGRRIVTIFSGDTIVHPAYWGRRALQHQFGRYITRVKLRHPFTPVYWFLISKGYKTYLLLTRNFPDHWPRFDRPTPPRERAIIDALAQRRFGPAWQAERGVVRFEAPAGRLRERVAPVDAAASTRADVRFFLERNPGHARGEELACLGRVTTFLWLRFALKHAWRRVRRARSRAAHARAEDAPRAT